MNYDEFIKEVIARFKFVMDAEFQANFSASFDNDGNIITLHGTCHKVAPGLESQYPDGWQMCQDYTIDHALTKLGLKIALING